MYIIKSYPSNHLFKVLNKIIKNIIYNLLAKILLIPLVMAFPLLKVATISIKIYIHIILDLNLLEIRQITLTEIKPKEWLSPVVMLIKFILEIINLLAYKKDTLNLNNLTILQKLNVL